MSGVTDQDKAILDFETEHSWWKYAGAKEAEIRDRFDLSPTRYYQRLNELLDDPEAATYSPTTVHRLRRLRDRRARTAGRDCGTW